MMASRIPERGSVSLARLPRVAVAVADLIARVAGVILDRDGCQAREVRVRGFLWGLFIRHRGLRIGRNIRTLGRKRIFLGDHVTLYGDTHIDASTSTGLVVVGSNSHIDLGCILYGQGGIQLGSGVAIAARCTIYSQTSQYRTSSGVPVVEQGTAYGLVTIGNDVWLGAAVTVVPGVVIGDHVVVGAGAVVASSIDDYCIVAGVPARVIGKRDG